MGLGQFQRDATTFIWETGFFLGGPTVIIKAQRVNKNNNKTKDQDQQEANKLHNGAFGSGRTSNPLN